MVLEKKWLPTLVFLPGVTLDILLLISLCLEVFIWKMGVLRVPTACDWDECSMRKSDDKS